MAHRALVAYERADGRYDVHASRSGGLHCRLSTAISPADPFASGEVEADPRVRDRPFESVLTMVDVARHEALYLVGADWTVETYLVLWFGLAHYLGQSASIESDGDGAPPGLLVAVESPAAAADLRQWLQAAKATVAEAVAGGYLDAEDAKAVLDRAARRRAGDRAVLAPER